VEEGARGVRRWVLSVFAGLAVFGIGAVLWWPPCAPPDRYSDLGTAIIGGGVIALAVLVLEQRYAAEADERDLLLTLGLGQSFVGMDLRGRDLSRAYLAGKDFSGARFEGATLRGTNLAGTNLTQASLAEADLRSTNFRGPPAPLYPSPTLYPGPQVYPSAGPSAGEQLLPDATFKETAVRDATYDDSTAWPGGYDPKEGGAVHVKDRSWWWRFRHY
jgi:hypothetical protein